MVVATKSEINKRKKKEEQFKKGLDEKGKMSDKKLCTQIRSAVRQAWMKHDTKLAYLYEKTYPDTNPKTRTKWLVDCEMCHTPTKISAIQVDHLSGEHSLLTLEDVVPFAKSILGVGFEDLQCVCVPCHEAKTYSERYSMSLEEAFKEKEVISKLKQTVAKQKAELKKAGYLPKEISNEAKRRECYRKLLRGEK